MWSGGRFCKHRLNVASILRTTLLCSFIHGSAIHTWSIMNVTVPVRWSGIGFDLDQSVVCRLNFPTCVTCALQKWRELSSISEVFEHFGR